MSLSHRDRDRGTVRVKGDRFNNKLHHNNNNNNNPSLSTNQWRFIDNKYFRNESLSLLPQNNKLSLNNNANTDNNANSNNNNKSTTLTKSASMVINNTSNKPRKLVESSIDRINLTNAGLDYINHPTATVTVTGTGTDYSAIQHQQQHQGGQFRSINTNSSNRPSFMDLLRSNEAIERNIGIQQQQNQHQHQQQQQQPVTASNRPLTASASAIHLDTDRRSEVAAVAESQLLKHSASEFIAPATATIAGPITVNRGSKPSGSVSSSINSTKPIVPELNLSSLNSQYTSSDNKLRSLSVLLALGNQSITDNRDQNKSKTVIQPESKYSSNTIIDSTADTSLIDPDSTVTDTANSPFGRPISPVILWRESARVHEATDIPAGLQSIYKPLIAQQQHQQQQQQQQSLTNRNKPTTTNNHNPSSRLMQAGSQTARSTNNIHSLSNNNRTNNKSLSHSQSTATATAASTAAGLVSSFTYRPKYSNSRSKGEYNHKWYLPQSEWGEKNRSAKSAAAESVDNNPIITGYINSAALASIDSDSDPSDSEIEAKTSPAYLAQLAATESINNRLAVIQREIPQLYISQAYRSFCDKSNNRHRNRLPHYIQSVQPFIDSHSIQFQSERIKLLSRVQSEYELIESASIENNHQQLNSILSADIELIEREIEDRRQHRLAAASAISAALNEEHHSKSTNNHNNDRNPTNSVFNEPISIKAILDLSEAENEGEENQYDPLNTEIDSNADSEDTINQQQAQSEATARIPIWLQ